MVIAPALSVHVILAFAALAVRVRQAALPEEQCSHD
jgi:hypothetical protein